MATGTARRRNPRGQGERLREDIIDAASRLLADPAAPPLTLRGVGRAAGVAATSVYLHFDDIDALVLAVAERHFGELLKAQQAARDAAPTPREAVRAMALAYCEFGLANRGLYQVMFADPLPPSADPREVPGRMAFEQRTDAIAECLGADSGGTDPAAGASGNDPVRAGRDGAAAGGRDGAPAGSTVASGAPPAATSGRAFRTSVLLWQFLHGTVGLRISRPGFPWPPLTETVTEAVDRILDAHAPT